MSDRDFFNSDEQDRIDLQNEMDDRTREEDLQYQEMIEDMQEQERQAFLRGLHEEDSDLETVRNYDALMDTQSQDDETPSSEEDLFRQIVDDERNDLDI